MLSMLSCEEVMMNVILTIDNRRKGIGVICQPTVHRGHTL